MFPKGKVVKCPSCNSADIKVFYTAPLQYECKSCGAKLRDENALPAISVVSGQDARDRRPRMYGLPCCAYCFHTPHDGKCDECRYCVEKAKPHVVKLIAA